MRRSFSSSFSTPPPYRLPVANGIRVCVAAEIPGDPKDKADLNGVTGRIPSEAEQATGRERLELNALLAGHDVRLIVAVLFGLSAR